MCKSDLTDSTTPVFLSVSSVSFPQAWGDGCGMLDVRDAGLEELTLNLPSFAFPKSGFQAITKRGQVYQECLSPLCAQPLFIFWGLVNLGPWINEMLSKRKPGIVNIPPDLMRILCPASPLTSCMTPAHMSQIQYCCSVCCRCVLWATSLG